MLINIIITQNKNRYDFVVAFFFAFSWNSKYKNEINERKDDRDK